MLTTHAKAPLIWEPLKGRNYPHPHNPKLPHPQPWIFGLKRKAKALQETRMAQDEGGHMGFRVQRRDLNT